MSVFTRITLDPKHTGSIRALTSRSRIHGILTEAWIPAPADRVLWHLESRGPRTLLYVVSDSAPLTDHLRRELGDVLVESRPHFSPEQLAGRRVRFKVEVNPLKSIFQRGQRGRRAVITDPQEQVTWLTEKMRAAGFEVASAQVVASRRESITRPEGKPLSLLAVTIEGVAQVLDADVAAAALAEGIGRSKAFGCGMILLAPLS